MGNEDDPIDKPMGEIEEHDAASAQQPAAGPSAGLQLLLADFQTRTQGMNATDFQHELDRLIDKMVDRAAGVAPPAIRAKVREAIYEMMNADPTMKTLMNDVRKTIRT
jgi:hypothetical protein